MLSSLGSESPSLLKSFAFAFPKHSSFEPFGRRLRKSAEQSLGILTGELLKCPVFEFVNHSLSIEECGFVREALLDPILYEVSFTQMRHSKFLSSIMVSKKHGVTDDEGLTAEKVFADRFSISSPQIRTHDLYLVENRLTEEQWRKLATTLLGNPLIHDFSFETADGLQWEARRAFVPTVPLGLNIYAVSLDTDEALLELSRTRHFALNLEEMRAIRAYFQRDDVQQHRKAKGLSQPTDCEWEIFAQTWSEHCKHKEFNAEIHFTDLDTGESRTIDSLFRSKIKKSTDIVDQRFREKGRSFLVKAFNDNAGIVRLPFRGEPNLVWKVETHNTPSALDPYSGAITGILGVNRDAMGTGVGGGRLLFNTNVLCFGPPSYARPLQAGQKHPRFVEEGVVAGIRDGGNKMGVPTVNGSVVYDERYAGKPLVFCGTAALMPARVGTRLSWEKPILAGDCIVMAGGKVGKDGIHGATLSSTEAHAGTPQTIVQVGSPVTQKFLADFLEEAVRRSWVKCCTDNGAGGLSSSIGELAEISGGAVVHLETVPLKYSGLAPWEIFLSESQERMTIVCESKDAENLRQLAKDREVDCTVIGTFTDTGFLDVRLGREQLAYLSLDFLHNGVPRKVLEAEGKQAILHEPALPAFESFSPLLLALLGSDNIRSRRHIVSQYDHEVKGRSIVKPLMGFDQSAPQDAAVVRLDFETYHGLAISNGIIPRYGDLDPYHMSAGSFDEAVRQIVSVGGKLPDPDDPTTSVWTVNDNFCLPNVVYDPEANPDGKLKLGKLVRMCDALFDMATFFNIPMTSGKDSMKNDFGSGNQKISVPPTVLYSMIASIEDVRLTVTSEWKDAGDLVYLVGRTYDELGGSEVYKLFNEKGAHVPLVRMADAKRVYQKMSRASSARLLQSSHDLSDGGLLLALAEASIGSGIGLRCELPQTGLSPFTFLFAESHSRFAVSVKKRDRDRFVSIMGSDALLLGELEDEPKFCVVQSSQVLVHCTVEEMKQAWGGELC
ncbi:MAG: phosphoribosylformylglycinamidine synthase [Deltaproteobacteria bacterium]|nr:phosphoribosylformylglycinamidine synthase [Deltaproteobacteria bacterium]